MLVLLLTTLASTFFLSEPVENFSAPLLPPNRHHILGTDDLGHDILSLLIHGGKTSIIVGLSAALVATVIGTAIGLASGYYRGYVDTMLMGVSNYFLLIPALPLMIILFAYLKPGIWNITFCIAFLGWAGTARVVRSRVMQVREMPFIMASRALGSSGLHIVIKHILPNTMEIVAARGALAVSGAMLAEAGFSFLGIGGPEVTSWGTMIAQAFFQGGFINGHYWWYLPPILCISVTVFGFAWIGFSTQYRREAMGESYPLFTDPIRLQSKKHALRFGSDGPLLSVTGLTVAFAEQNESACPVLNGIDLDIQKGERVAIIGESAGGKSILLLSLLGLMPENATVSGAITYKGVTRPADEWPETAYALRGRAITYVPQGAGNALNPLLPVVTQVAEPLVVHQRINRNRARRQAGHLMEKMGLDLKRTGTKEFPHHLSGGMKQRALTAMAMAGDPNTLLVDEPTKGLDWKTRDDVLSTFLELDSKTMLVVTHDLWFAERLADRILVMYAGKIIETASVGRFFSAPRHPYSQVLLAALPSHGLNTITIQNRRSNPDLAEGCAFIEECPRAFDQCYQTPPLIQRKGGRVRCWLYVC